MASPKIKKNFDFVGSYYFYSFLKERHIVILSQSILDIPARISYLRGCRQGKILPVDGFRDPAYTQRARTEASETRDERRLRSTYLAWRTKDEGRSHLLSHLTMTQQ